jgi:hypothetical protein
MLAPRTIYDLASRLVMFWCGFWLDSKIGLSGRSSFLFVIVVVLVWTVIETALMHRFSK